MNELFIDILIFRVSIIWFDILTLPKYTLLNKYSEFHTVIMQWTFC